MVNPTFKKNNRINNYLFPFSEKKNIFSVTIQYLFVGVFSMSVDVGEGGQNTEMSINRTLFSFGFFPWDTDFRLVGLTARGRLPGPTGRSRGQGGLPEQSQIFKRY